jgi:AhpD family alkylhydroperoxidase
MKLDQRTIRLIAVGASMAANCQPCLQINAAKAAESGADRQEIAEAVAVGKMVRQGAGSKMDRFAASLELAADAPAGRTEEGCGCSL